MILQLNLAAIIAVASQTVWRKAKTIIFQDTFLFPALGCLGIILLWWVVALANHELMPTPPEALIANWDYILHPFYERGPGDLGVGWLLLASLRRVILGFGLGALVAIPLGFLIGMSRPAMLAFNPIIQIFKPVSPLAWLPISLSLFNLADPSAIFVI
ncbi:MAG: ABC transporter permease, partial [Dolichospermum sp.]